MNRRLHPTTVRVYFAGKIEANDWRHSIYPNLRGACSSNYEAIHLNEWPCVEELTTIPFDEKPYVAEYAGPFFLSCDHGCFHGPNKHGLLTDEESMEEPHFNESQVVELAKRWIIDSDLMFVWLEDTSAYGTLAEIGFAHALGVPIFLYCKDGPNTGDEPNRSFFPESLKDLWFVRHLATYVHGATSPQEAFQHFLDAPRPMLDKFVRSKFRLTHN